MEYASFWRRIGAYSIDAIVLLPIMALSYFFGERYRLFNLFWLIPETVFGIWFNVYLVSKYGGTPGKLLLGTKIAMLDGSPITLKAAVIRHSIFFALSFSTALSLALASLSITDALYFSLGYLAKIDALKALTPSWFELAMAGIQFWVVSEFISMLFNKKRRALHDFMAGTVVIRFKQ